jgi:hypothetical protein
MMTEIAQTTAPSSLITEWKNRWSAKLEQSRPYWIKAPHLPIEYNPAAPSVANDPDDHQIIHAHLFSIIRLILPSKLEGRAISRYDLSAASAAKSNLLHEFASNSLLTDPENENLLLLVNRWPKIKYHSLLVSSTVRVQKLTVADVNAQLHWARRGVLSEFHRAERFVNHFHIHVFPQEATPLSNWANTFTARTTINHVSMGALAYPFCHIAFSSSDLVKLAQTATNFAEYLDDNDYWYNENAVASPDGIEMTILFFVWAKCRRQFGFVTAGFLSCDYSVTVPSVTALTQMSGAWFDDYATEQVKNAFSAGWKSHDSET